MKANSSLNAAIISENIEYIEKAISEMAIRIMLSGQVLCWNILP